MAIYNMTDHFFRNYLATLLLLFVSLMILSVQAALASGLRISPVRVELTASQQSEKMTIANTFDDDVIIEASVYRWQQIHGEEILTPTADIALSSEIFSISKGQSMTLLLGLLKQPEPATIETSYRLVLRADSVPIAHKSTGTKFSLSISIPIFLAPTANGEPAITSRIQQGDDNSCSVNIRNDGARFVRLQKLTIQDINGNILPDIWSNEYLLPNSETNIPLTNVKDLHPQNIQLDYIWGGSPNKILFKNIDNTCKIKTPQQVRP